MTRTPLRHHIEDLLEELASYAAVLDGPDDLADLFADLDDYPQIDQHADCNYAIGYIVGAAGALGVTSWALLDELGLATDRDTLYARWRAKR